MQYLDLQILKNTFYTLTKIPLYILQQDFNIAFQSDNATVISPSFFHNFIEHQNEKERYTVFFTEQEIYIFFKLSDAIEDCHHVCIGPIIFNLSKHISNLDFLLYFKYGNITNQQEALKALPTLDSHLYEYIQFLYGLFYQEKLTRERFYQYFYHPRRLKYSNHFLEILYASREAIQNDSNSYQNELLLLEAIRKGNSTYARIYASKLANGNIRKMSDDQLRNGKYAVIAGITLISRTAIEVGANPENAYALSDVYINKIDMEYDVKKLMTIFYDTIMDFCLLINTHKQQSYPAWVRSCMEYMDQHLHIPVTLDDLSSVVHLTPAYISVQFKKIVGRSIKQYLNEQRVHESKFLLKTTNTSVQDIALTLNFGTQSYFTKVFKQITDISPSMYRKTKKH